MEPYQMSSDAGDSSLDDSLDNSHLLSTMVDNYHVAYDPTYIRRVTIGECHLDNPLSIISEDRRSCKVLVPEPLNLGGSTTVSLAILAKGKISKIILHSMTYSTYHLNINGVNVCSSKNNIFDLTTAKPNSMLEIYQQLQQETDCLDFDKVDTAIICVQNSMKLPEKFYYTVVRPDGTRRTYVNHISDNIFLNGKCAGLEIPMKDQLLIQMDGIVMLHIRAKDHCLHPVIVPRIHLKDNNNETYMNLDRVNQVTYNVRPQVDDSSSRKLAYIYREYNYPQMTHLYGPPPSGQNY